MPVTDDRVRPLLSVRLGSPGSGGVMDDSGFRLYDVLQQVGRLGSVSLNSDQQPELEILDGVGLVCRPKLVLQDTRLSEWTTSGGSWDERRMGVPRTYRLIQDSTAAADQWSATSSFDFYADPQVAFSFLFFDTPPDWDAATYPQYVRVEFGGEWALQFHKQYGTLLLRKVGSDWQAVLEVPEPVTSAGADLGERYVILRVLRGRICLSTDYGRSYVQYALPGVSLSVAEAPLVLRGQGSQCVFGVHQLVYETGVWAAPTRNTFTSRSLLAAPTLSGRTQLPAGTSITLTDAGTPTSGLAAYTATLAPSSSGTTPFAHYRTPELYSVKLAYETSRTALPVQWTTPWDWADDDSASGVVSASISKPPELDGATATVAIRLDPDTQFSGDFRWCPVQLLAGALHEDGSVTSQEAFTGYVRAVTVSQDEYRKPVLTLTCENATIRAKRMKWDSFTAPLTGQTVNAALDEVLAAMGLTTADRLWHSAGDLISLPWALPENPLLWPRAGESFWQTLSTIAEYAGLELGALDDGRFFTLPKNYADAAVSHVLQAAPDTNLNDGVQRVSFSADYGESVTRCLCVGTDAWGNPIFAYARDSAAEGNLLSGRFCPWPELDYVQVPGSTTPGLLVRQTQYRFLDLAPLQYLAAPEVLLKLDLQRRQRVRIEGLKVGIEDTDEFVVLAMTHELRPALADCKTALLVRRVNR